MVALCEDTMTLTVVLALASAWKVIDLPTVTLHSPLESHMSDALSSETSPPVVPALSPTERRILGVMVEKAKTTPDAYPMSINALVTGSNQKSNRDPVLNLTDLDVEEALTSAQQKGLTTRITGSRVERWRHNLYEVLHVGKVELAILAELLLRGPQTEGELRGRASRMEDIPDLETLRGVLRPLAERRLIVFLGPEGRRGTLITHGFHAPRELEGIQAKSQALAAEQPVHAAGESPPSPPPETAQLREELAALREQVSHLQAGLADVTEQLKTLKASLGEGEADKT
jgi:uncharacterized protein YceH (UPF0502 family)